jgi:hypothetical protein
MTCTLDEKNAFSAAIVALLGIFSYLCLAAKIGGALGKSK